jgi:cytochrome c-type biogenesis protein
MNPSTFIEHLAASVTHYPAVALLVAIVGGIFSTSTCPCTIPAGVGIIGYVGAQGTGGRDDNVPAGRHASSQFPSGVALAAAFFAGLVLALGVLGTTAAVVGRLLTQWKTAFALGAAAVTLVAGLTALLGPALRRRMPNPAVRNRGSVAGAFAYGVMYSMATLTTSAGPLFLLLTIAAAIGRPLYGAALSVAYGLGRGVPFLALGIFASRVQRWLDRLDRGGRVVEVGSGLALLGLAAYFVRFAGVGG